MSTDTAELLSSYRLAHHLTWDELAARVGLTTSGVWKIAKRKVRPTELSAHMIREALAEAPIAAGGAADDTSILAKG